MQRRARGSVFLLIAFGILPVAGAGDPPDEPAAVDELAAAMELNRSGRWQEAADLANGLIETGKLSAAATCEAYYHSAYARSRLGLVRQASSLVELFDSECAGVERTHWMHREMERLKGESGQRTPYVPDETDTWQTGDAAELGLDPEIVRRHEALCERTCADSCLVVFRDRIVSERYSTSYRPPIHAMSSTKSVTGLLVGMMIDDGKIGSVDEPVGKYVPQWSAGRRGEVTIRHLLTHTSGLRRMWEDGVGSTGDKNAFVVALEPAHGPGTRFEYSNEGVQLLSPILDRAAGEPVQTYARRRLFEPLGMWDTSLKVDAQGHAWTYADMQTTARDLARLGLLMLDRGKVGDRQIVSEAWIERSTRPMKLDPGYGLLWWLSHDPPGFAAMGHLNTNVYVFPRADIVVVRTQSSPCETDESVYARESRPLLRRMVADVLEPKTRRKTGGGAGPPVP